MRAARPLVFPPDVASAGWRVRALAGRLVEVSGWHDPAQLTAAFGLVLETQLAGDQAAWITLAASAFFPPDVAEGGVDLDALPIVRVPDARAAGRAADHLVRSGGFGLVAIDLADTCAPHLPVPVLARLLGSARAHDTAVLVLTKKSGEAASLDSLVAVRVEARRVSLDAGIAVQVHARKDKRHGPGWTETEVCRGPAGLR